MNKKTLKEEHLQILTTAHPKLYVDAWSFPVEAFVDIYDLSEQLSNAGDHILLQGRRGIGKTLLMVKSYLNIRNAFEINKGTPPYNLAIYINLNEDGMISSDENLPTLHAFHLYRKILDSILTVKGRSERHRRDRRLWGLEDFLNARPNWFVRNYARWRVRRYKNYISALGELIAKSVSIQETQRHSTAFSAEGSGGITLPERNASIYGGYSAKGQRSKEIEKRIEYQMQLRSSRIRSLLENIYQAMGIENLILFIDEWSSDSVGLKAQPHLYKFLTQTFPSGGKTVMKIAAVPGMVRLTGENSKTPNVKVLNLDQAVAVKGNVIRNRYLELLIRNLAAFSTNFPKDTYMTPDPEVGIEAFKKSVFDKQALDEFFRAGENLPRQMVDIFTQAARIRSLYTPNQKFSKEIIRNAACNYFRSCQDKYHVSVNPILSEILTSLLRAGSKVIDIERSPNFILQLDTLIGDGTLIKCEANLSNLDHRFDRFILGYPADVYRLINSDIQVSLEKYKSLEIEDINNCAGYKNPGTVSASSINELVLARNDASENS